MQVFSELVRSIQRTQAELVLAIEEKQRQTESWAEGLITELEQEIAELKKRNSDLEHVSRADHIHFLKVRACTLFVTIAASTCSCLYYNIILNTLLKINCRLEVWK